MSSKPVSKFFQDLKQNKSKKLIIFLIVILLIIILTICVFAIKLLFERTAQTGISSQQKLEATPTVITTVSLTPSDAQSPSPTPTQVVVSTISSTPTATAKPTVTSTPTPNPYKTDTSHALKVRFQYPSAATVTEKVLNCHSNITITLSRNRSLQLSFYDILSCSQPSTYTCTAKSSSPVKLSNGQTVYKVQYTLDGNPYNINYDQFGYYNAPQTKFSCALSTQSKLTSFGVYHAGGNTPVQNDTVFNIVMTSLVKI